MKTFVAVLAAFVFTMTVAQAQTAHSVRRLVRQADFIGIIQAEPNVSDPHGEYRQGVFVLSVEAIKGSWTRNPKYNNQYPAIWAAHAGVTGYPTQFEEKGEYLVFLKSTAEGAETKWRTVAAYLVRYYPAGLSNAVELGNEGVVGLLTSDASAASSLPVITITEARRWLFNMALEKPLKPAEEAKIEQFFQASRRSKEASLTWTGSTHEKRMALASKLAGAIQPGMTRAWVEKIFPQSDGGAFGPGGWRCYFGSEVMIDVPYDTTGGPFQPENRVNGPLRVYRDMMHLD